MASFNMRRRGLWLALISLAALLPVCGFGQSAVLGTVSGVVTDASGAVVPGASITITRTGTQIRYSTNTNALGFYAVPNLPAGDYKAVAEKTGFRACENANVHLDPASSVQLSCTMQVGTVAQSVVVTAPLVTIQLDTSQLSRLIDSQTMTELPVNGRNFMSLLALQPGVATTFNFNDFLGTNLGTPGATHVNGIADQFNNVLIDGDPSTRTRGNTNIVAMPSMDAIDEVNVVTTTFMPEFSRAAGGQIIVSLKSGTDRYHGGAFEYDRNTVFDARSFFSTTGVPQLDLNQFGFSIGGPVIPKKHKLYFFWTEEWLRNVNGNVGLTTIPSMSDRQGNFVNYCAASVKQCPKVPAYLNGIGGLVAGTAFPGNIVPSSLWSPNGSAIAHLYLAPNTPGTKGGEANNFSYNYPTFTNWQEDSVKVDFEVTEKNHLAVSLRHFAETNFQRDKDSPASQLLNQVQNFPGRGASVNLVTSFAPTLLNDISITATEDISRGTLPSNLPGVNRTALGINYPYIGPVQSKDLPDKIPTVAITGEPTLQGLTSPYHSVGHIYTIQDVLTKVTGKHTVKTGIWWEHDGEIDGDAMASDPNGAVTFGASSTDPNTTGSPYADALLGNFDTYIERGWRNVTPYAAFQFGAFGQDTWKVTRRLTIVGGLRWDYYQPYSAKWNNAAEWNPGFYSFAPGVEPVVSPVTGYVTSGNPYDGLIMPGFGLPMSAIGHMGIFGEAVTAQNIGSINQQLRNYGITRGLTPQILQGQYNNWQPRLGFAFDPTGKGTTAIRGGAGIFYSHFPVNDSAQPGGNPPMQYAFQVVNGHVDNPGGTPGVQLPITPASLDLQNKTPVVYEWSFTAEHRFAENTLVSVSYVGNQGRHSELFVDLNQAAIGTYTNPANKGIAQAALVPYPGIGVAKTEMNEGNSSYNSLQVSVRRKLSRGLSYGVAYTYSKCLDEADYYQTGSNVADTYDVGYNWGNCGFNPTQSLILTYVYDLPFLQNRHSLIGRTLGGWELSGTAALVTGQWSSVAASGDPLGNGANNFGATEFADLAPNCSIRGDRSFYKFFNTACFSQPTVSTLAGTASRNDVEGPGLDNWDFALMKNGHITERVNYQFRAEFFNFLNHPSFTSISTGVTSSNFGYVTGVDTPREIQFGLRLRF